jgi:hypothetical protein
LDVTFEYILATIVIFIMLGASIFTVTSLTTSQLALVTEQQITPTAQQLVDKILLTPGSPVDWGYNITVNASTIRDFGLSLAAPSAPLYEVDPFKLMKLINDSSSVVNSLYVDPTTAGTMLGLYANGHPVYGYRLYIVPALNISVAYTNVTLAGSQTFPDDFVINVQTSDGVPAASAAVHLNVFEFVTTNGDNYTSSLTSGLLTTDYKGDAEYTFGAPPAWINSSQAANFLITINANYYGVSSDTIFQDPIIPSAFSALQDGQYLVCNLTQPVTFLHPALHPTWNFTVVELTKNLNIIEHLAVDYTGVGIPNSQLNYNNSLRIFGLTNQITSDVIFSGMLVQYGSETFFVGSTFPHLPVTVDYHPQAFASDLSSALLLSSVTVQRYVHISTLDYSVYLTLWRMST